MSAPEPTHVVRRETISPLADRSTGRLTYEVAVDGCGEVSISVVDKPLFVSVSSECVPIVRVRTLLAGPLATGEPFATRLLARAFVRAAKQNSLVLAAVLCHEGLLRLAGEAPKMHSCIGDWDDWVFVQRGRVAQQAERSASFVADGRGAHAFVSGDARVIQASTPVAPEGTTPDPDAASDADALFARNATSSRLE
jgi:hypothetical protein